MDTVKQQQGKLTVIYGPMFSGKTHYLFSEITKIERAKIGKKIIIIRHEDDKERFSSDRKNMSSSGQQSKPDKIRTHDGYEIATDTEELFLKKLSLALLAPGGRLYEYDVIGIDEGQWFDGENGKELSQFVLMARNLNKRCFVVGLTLDACLNTFKAMTSAIAYADEVVQRKAVCKKCGNDAIYSSLKNKDDIVINTNKGENYKQVGTSQHYEALCGSCFFKLNQITFL